MAFDHGPDIDRAHPWHHHEYLDTTSPDGRIVCRLRQLFPELYGAWNSASYLRLACRYVSLSISFSYSVICEPRMLTDPVCPTMLKLGHSLWVLPLLAIMPLLPGQTF